jgi:hypothetical protein
VPAYSAANQVSAAKAASAAAPGEWQAWYWICVGGVVVFIATIFVMRGPLEPSGGQQPSC